MGSDPGEAKIFDALADEKYLWRTLPALQRASGMTEAEVIAVLWRNSPRIIEGATSTGEKVWALRDRYWKQAGILQIFTSTSSR
jgi:hypothetical protein